MKCFQKNADLSSPYSLENDRFYSCPVPVATQETVRTLPGGRRNEIQCELSGTSKNPQWTGKGVQFQQLVCVPFVCRAEANDGCIRPEGSDFIQELLRCFRSLCFKTGVKDRFKTGTFGDFLAVYDKSGFGHC